MNIDSKTDSRNSKRGVLGRRIKKGGSEKKEMSKGIYI